MTVKPKLFRDPVHDIISLQKELAGDRLLLALIEAPEMQRLRRIRQLGFSNFVYHGAEHSRFVHSMGVCALANRMYRQLRPNGDEDERVTVVAAALCHDLGHGPFSHVMERITDIHHEAITVALVLSEETAIHRVLSEYDPQLPQRVAAFYDINEARNPLHDIVSSQLDADRCDYILRDGLATGVKIGVFDLERIITMLEERDGSICVNFRATEAVEGYLLARFHMYKQVYLHKASRAAERMLEAAVRRVRYLVQSNFDFQWFPQGALSTLIKGQQLSALDVATLDDTDIWFALKKWSGEDDAILAQLAGGLVWRQLYKTIAVEAGAKGDEQIEHARKRALEWGFDPDYHVLVDSSADTPYTPYLPGSGRQDQSIRIVTAGGDVLPIENVSEVVRLLGIVEYQTRRLVVPDRLAAQLRQ